MTDPAVTRFPGVYRRSDSNIYQFGLKAPDKLRHHFRGPWAVRCSPGTADLREANDKARALHAEWAGKFEALRKADNPQPVALNAALSTAVAAELRRWVLEADDNMRSFPEGPRALIATQARQQLPDLADDEPLLAALGDALKPTLLAELTIGGQAAPVAPQRDPLAGIVGADRKLSHF